MKQDELPDSLRGMTPEQRQAYVDKQMAERKTLNERLAALVKQRDRYVREQAKKAPPRTGDSFDRAVEATLRAQIKR